MKECGIKTSRRVGRGGERERKRRVKKEREGGRGREETDTSLSILPQAHPSYSLQGLGLL